MTSEFINCFELDIAKDIPAELTFYKNQYQTLTHHNHIYKQVLIGATTVLCLYVLYKTLERYENKKKNKETSYH
ncbi:hypothetical protein GCM10022393_41070 [Aquimarina addita]|uniref:Uncharacterized protein n=1 Tax=Aquimarina addita TaxID=870485 RepID=A0ABP6UTS3_9FLAO